MPGITNKQPLIIGAIKYEINEGFVFIERLERMKYGLEDLKKNIGNRVEYTEGYSYPVILFGCDMISMDKPSRDFMAGEGAKNTLSRAYVVEKSQGKLQLDFFMNTYKQPVPTQIFDSLEEAVEWSKRFSRI